MNMPLVLLNRRRRGGATAFSPSTLFALAEPGVWFDPSDLTTLFQDPAGTTPVTAPGNTVGLMLDKSRGGEQSLPTTGWTVNSGDGVVTIVDNVITITGATTTTRVDITSPGWVVGDYVKMTVNASIGSSTGALLYIGGAPYSASAGAATYASVVSVASGTLTRVQISSGSATFTVTARSRTPGNHATQATLAARPTYSIEPVGGRRNLLLWSEDFGNGVWTKNGLTVPATQFVAPDGSSTADKLSEDSSTGNHRAITQGPISTGLSYRFSVYAKAAERSRVMMRTFGGVDEDTYFDLSGSGSVVSGVGLIEAIGTSGWFRISRTFTSSVTSTTLFSAQVYLVSTGTTISYTGTTGDGIYIWGAQFEVGT